MFFENNMVGYHVPCKVWVASGGGEGSNFHFDDMDCVGPSGHKNLPRISSSGDEFETIYLKMSSIGLFWGIWLFIFEKHDIEDLPL